MLFKFTVIVKKMICFVKNMDMISPDTHVISYQICKKELIIFILRFRKNLNDGCVKCL